MQWLLVCIKQAVMFTTTRPRIIVMVLDHSGMRNMVAYLMRINLVLRKRYR
jgi:hypothetical protein